MSVGAAQAETERRASKLVVDAIAALGVDPALVERAMVSDAWREVYDREVPALAALAGSLSLPYGSYEVVDFLASSAATIGEGFGRLARYLPVVNRTSTFTWDVGADRVFVRIIGLAREPSWFGDEWLLGATIRGFRGTAGDAFSVETVRLRAPPPAVPDRFPAVASLRMEFGAPEAGLVLSRAVWDLPSPRANSRLHEVLVAHAEELLGELSAESATSQRVRQELLTELRGGEPSVQVVAKKLATTPRTLQRRLAEEGTSFAGILDGARRDLATRYLADAALSVTEVAFLLGFSEASAFARAHRRWFGRAPREPRAGSPTT